MIELTQVPSGTPQQILTGTITGNAATPPCSAKEFASLLFGIEVTAIRSDGGANDSVTFQLETSFDAGVTWFALGNSFEFDGAGRKLIALGRGAGSGDFGALVRIAYQVRGVGADVSISVVAKA